MVNGEADQNTLHYGKLNADEYNIFFLKIVLSTRSIDSYNDMVLKARHQQILPARPEQFSDFVFVFVFFFLFFVFGMDVLVEILSFI